MKNMFSADLFKLAYFIKAILLLTFIIIVFNACKKDLLKGEKETLTIAQNGGVKIANINYNDFLKKVNLNNLGTLKSSFQSKQTNGKLMSLGGVDMTGGLGFLTDSIKQITTSKGNSFVFRMPQTSEGSRIFQNLTISLHKDTAIVFITTYKPSNEWIINRKNNIHKAYNGEISYTPISLSTSLSLQFPILNNSLGHGNGKVMTSVPNNVMQSVTVCNTFTMFTELPTAVLREITCQMI
jgi:hypothetical protein